MQRIGHSVHQVVAPGQSVPYTLQMQLVDHHFGKYILIFKTLSLLEY